MTDPNTIQIVLKYPFAPFMDSISYQHVSMVPHEVYERDGREGLRRFVDAGYQIGHVTGFDLFPLTPHVETVTVFESDSPTLARRSHART